MVKKKHSKKISKSAQLKEDQHINVMLRKKFDKKVLEKERKEADKDDIIIHENLDLKDLNKFNSASLIEAMKNSGLDTGGSVFADMERIVNNNESIRELVDIKNIRMKTKVTEEQHHIIVVLANVYNTLLIRFNINHIALKNLLSEFIEIAPSIDGERAGQFVTAHQAVAQAVANAQHNSNAIREPDGKQ
jgi:hypothetical protein